VNTESGTRHEDILREAIQLKAAGLGLDQIVAALKARGHDETSFAPVVGGLFEAGQKDRRETILWIMIGGPVLIVIGALVFVAGRPFSGVWFFGAGVTLLITGLRLLMARFDRRKGRKNDL
jgi:hypothetical protein